MKYQNGRGSHLYKKKKKKKKKKNQNMSTWIFLLVDKPSEYESHN